MMNLINIANQRYSTKAFDPAKHIPNETFAQIKHLLRLSPSSVNIQPWHFIIASADEGRRRIAKAMAPSQYAYNIPKVVNASHVIVYCAKTGLSNEYIQHITDTEYKDGRYTSLQSKEKGQDTRVYFINKHRLEGLDVRTWMEKQVYLNIGTILLATAMLGLDAIPMEGFDADIMNAEFDLHRKGYTALVVVSLGYHAENDFNASKPKSRLPEEEILTELD